MTHPRILKILFLSIITLFAFSCTPSTDTGDLIDSIEFDANGSGETDWETAVAILNSGEVEIASQSHSLDVELFLKDGRIINTVEPGIDDIFDEIDACGEPCAEIILMTE